MTKLFARISAILFVGVFVFAMAFTLVANSAFADPDPPPSGFACCDILSGDIVVGWGIWYLGEWPSPGYCRCVPLHPDHNINECPLWCPKPM
jgi:hypothetical protein